VAVKKFLIVDDDMDDRDMFCEALGEVISDSICYNATNGRRAMMALDEAEIDIPDLIFLDINMPVMNGWQFLTKLKEANAYQNIPVIMYSTSSYPEDIEKAQHLGAICFFSKPANFKALKQNLALVVEHLKAGTLATLVDSSPLFLTRSVE
jgi:CheY-like chemotaxis protein